MLWEQIVISPCSQSRHLDLDIFSNRRVISIWISKLNKTSKKLVKELDNLLVLVATHFFVYPDTSQGEDLDQWQFALYPEVLYGAPDTPQYAYAKTVENELHKLLDNITIYHHEYRSLVRKRLML
jgi:hypothetical protein